MKPVFARLFKKPDRLLAIGIETQLRGDLRELKFARGWQGIPEASLNILRQRANNSSYVTSAIRSVQLHENDASTNKFMDASPQCSIDSKDAGTQCSHREEAGAKHKKVLMQKIRRLQGRKVTCSTR